MILLAKRSAGRMFYPGVWDIVGGHLEGSETPAETLVRELAEEIGVQALHSEQIAVVDVPQSNHHAGFRYHVFIVTAWRGEPRILNSEHSELLWASFDDAVALPLAYPGYGALFRKALKRASAGSRRA